MRRVNNRYVNAPTTIRKPATGKKPRFTKSWWLKQFHTWHWVSAAVSLIGMIVFTATGVTLNHAASIPGTAVVDERAGTLAPSLLRLLERTPNQSDAPIPGAVAQAVSGAVKLDPAGRPAEWSDGEVYIAMPRPGGDAWVSIDRTSGAIKAEVTSQGWIALLNDLHKGRNTGLAWRIFIDVFAAAALVFTLSGVLLLQLHAKHRKSTWPLVGLGLLVPLAIAIVFIH